MAYNDNYGGGSVSIDSELIETIIGLNTKFKGSVKTDKVLRIDGEFEGEIDSTDKVIISETGKFKGTIKCSELKLDGYCEGKLTCMQLLRIADIGIFSGDVITKNIIMTEGSLLDGTCTMKTMR